MADDPGSMLLVYAVVRLDLFLEETAPTSEVVTVKEVLPIIAEAEVTRLNANVDPNRVLYLVQPTRYYPNGRPVSRADNGRNDDPD
jgi:hypothetical protein